MRDKISHMRPKCSEIHTQPRATESFDADMIQQVEQQQLLNPLLLFVIGHRPLAFVFSQALYLFAPLAAIAGIESVARWANLLSKRNENEALCSGISPTKKF